jgi:hypothetical protein
MAPSGGTALFDVNINGTSIWDGDQSQRITIPDGGTNHQRTGLTAGVAVDDEITLDFDGFTGGATGIGSFIQVLIDIEETGASATDAELGGGATAGAYLPIEAEGDQGNAYNTIEWDTPLVDDGGFYDGGTFSITVPADGWYNVSFNLLMHSTEAGKIQVDVSIDGNLAARYQQMPLAGDETFSIQGSVNYFMLEGHEVLMGITQAGTPGFAVDVLGTFLSIVPAGLG